MIQHDLSPDTQAMLLLCGNLGQRGENASKPLGPKQYSALAAWLKMQAMSLADLLTPEGRAQLADAGLTELPASRVDPLLDRGAALALVVERWQRSGIWIVSRVDESYPERLAKYLDQAAPPVLYGVGSVRALGKGGLAVVGSRDRSDDDGAYARRAGERCAREGIPVISGAAKGIDRDAMSGALECGGVVVGVLAEGVAKYAVSPELRDHIADGHLTLVSAYEPEMRWQTWTAMERNKLLYGMSDAALVVASGEESGGTWAGATEALRAKRVRVYVRTGDTMPAGNSRLLSMGALAFPSEPWIDFLDLLMPPVAEEKPVASVVVKPEPAPPPVEAAPPVVRDAYSLVLPEMLLALRQPLDDKTMAELFQVRGPQMKDWLERAMAEGRVEKTKRPVRYVVKGISLFES
jgi:predicted Rossmann fold nucleotide-binding protein DprA/Smf involved in DNA uptake